MAIQQVHVILNNELKLFTTDNITLRDKHFVRLQQPQVYYSLIFYYIFSIAFYVILKRI